MKVGVRKSRRHRCELKGSDLRSLISRSGFTVTSKDPEFYVICGGDGTFLDEAKTADKPVLFIRDEVSVGALSTGSLSDLPRLIKRIEDGNYWISSHRLLSADGALALADVYFTHTDGSGTVQYVVKSGKEEFVAMASSCIFSTPLGSTGYAKSAGAMPFLKERILVVNACPYDKVKVKGKVVEASNKLWYFFSPRKRLKFELMWPKKANMHVDGKFVRTVERGEVVEIKYTNKKVKLIKFDKEEYVDVVDVVVARQGKVLLVKRKNEPYKGKYALPGGHVERGEREEEAAKRELEEETGLVADELVEFGHYFGKERDPRYPTYSVVFSAKATGELKAGGDASEARWVSFKRLSPSLLAFDHWKILNDFCRWQNKTIGWNC